MHFSLLVIILIINNFSIFAIKTKSQPPVAIHPYRPMARHIACQCMQVPTRHIHFLWSASHVQNSQLTCQLLCMVGTNARLAPGQEKFLKPFMRETLYHEAVSYNASRNRATNSCLPIYLTQLLKQLISPSILIYKIM